MNRREFFLATLSGSALLSLPSWARDEKLNSYLIKSLTASPLDMAPLQRLSRFGGSSVIEGDEEDDAHEIFWNKDGFIAKKGGIPAVSAEYDFIIVGGGIAGLASAHMLKGKKILLIEGNSRLGGNSKSQYIGKSFTSQGAAYITVPERGDEIDTFLGDLRIKNLLRPVDHTDEAVLMNGSYVKGFWDGATDEARASEFKRAHEKLIDVYENSYPELPVWDDSSSGKRHFNSLDEITFQQWLERELGSVHPHIMEYITLYCWSSFSASPDEISAAQGLNFLACDTAGTLVLPGGNGLIAEAIYQDLRKRSGVTILNKAFAVDIKADTGKAVVCYKNAEGKLITVRARHCICANSKMINKKIISTLPVDQFKAMNDITYRAYMVANIFLKKKVPSVGYDIFDLSGKSPVNNVKDSNIKVYPDIVFSDWAMKDVADKSILTLYIPLPYDMAQQYLFVPTLYQKYQDKIKQRLLPALAGLGLSWADVEGMRLVRYGHALPLAERRGVSSGLFETASKSIDGCIHFANQDNWGNPCFETSFGSAYRLIERL